MTTKEFIQYASERAELCEKLSACTTPEEGYAIAKEQGLTDDLATFTQVMTAAKNESEALSDEEIDKIQAAANTTEIATWTATSSAFSAIIFSASLA